MTMDEPTTQELSAGGPPPPNEPDNNDARSHVSAENDNPETVATTGNPVPLHANRPVKSGVRYYNLQGFVNRVENDNWDYTVEVLVARPIWDEAVKAEENRRSAAAMADSGTEDGPGRVAGALMASSAEKLGESRRIQRVRIRSPTVLGLISDLAEWKDSDLLEGKNDAMLFGRPFRTLEYCHEAMKQKLAAMELAEAEETAKKARAVEATNGTTPANQTPPVSDTDGRQGPHRPTPLQDMRVYVGFVENTIMPMWKRFGGAERGASPSQILYNEIPFLFKPGELAYVAPSRNKSTGPYPSAEQTMFKVLYCVPRDLATGLGDGGGWSQPGTETMVHLHCLDYDGERFRPVYRAVEFRHYFEDEEEITSLPCYPLRFHPDYEALLKRHTEMGEWFRNCVEGGPRHLYYSGWTLVTGMFTGDDRVGEEKHPEHIESEVIVDFKEASRHIQDWITTEAPSYNNSSAGRRNLACRMMYWSRSGVAHKPVLQRDLDRDEVLLIREDSIHAMDAAAFFKNDRWVQGKEPADSFEWNPHDLVILPRRILGYVLRRRIFARLDTQSFQIQREGRRATLRDIKMKDEYRDMIRSAVWSHFDRREKERDSVIPEYQPDIIKGKGKGVVILLHGAPGVGKTSTAEAVAQEYEKPLFPITCGDLGVKAEVVEETLQQIFRYAHVWDCVLLLDEADVFLTQRDRYNVERNALVSVFLRMLEYYNGILFLTTNRVGALDEAFRSRIHLSLYYPHLSSKDTLAILKDGLNRLPRVENVGDGETIGSDHIQVQDDDIEKFVEGEFRRFYKKHKRGPWNGRQIRNAVQIASCLALYEAQKTSRSNVRAVLTSTHFKTVFETTAEFDRYLKQARRADESKLAHMQGDRFDPFDHQDHDGHGLHEPAEFKTIFPSTWEKGSGGAASRQDGRRLPEPPQNPSRQPPSHPPNARPSNMRGNNRYLDRAAPGDPDNYDDWAQGRDRRPPNRNHYQLRTAEDDVQHGEFDEHDDLDADRGGPGWGGFTDDDDDGGGDIRDSRGSREVGDAREVRDSRGMGRMMGGGENGNNGGDPRRGSLRAQAGFSGRPRANVSASRRGGADHFRDEDDNKGRGVSPYNDAARRRNWDDERDMAMRGKPAPRGDMPERRSGASEMMPGRVP